MISTNLLHDIAVYVNGRVAKVVLNGSYEITDFRVKEVTDNVLALNYLVPAADVSLITHIELQDANGDKVTTNQVYVPITTDHLMLQTITVKEAL